MFGRIRDAIKAKRQFRTIQNARKVLGISGEDDPGTATWGDVVRWQQASQNQLQEDSGAHA